VGGEFGRKVPYLVRWNHWQQGTRDVKNDAQVAESSCYLLRIVPEM